MKTATECDHQVLITTTQDRLYNKGVFNKYVNENNVKKDQVIDIEFRYTCGDCEEKIMKIRGVKKKT